MVNSAPNPVERNTTTSNLLCALEREGVTLSSRYLLTHPGAFWFYCVVLWPAKKESRTFSPYVPLDFRTHYLDHLPSEVSRVNVHPLTSLSDPRHPSKARSA